MYQTKSSRCHQLRLDYEKDIKTLQKYQSMTQSMTVMMMLANDVQRVRKKINKTFEVDN